MNGVPYQRCQSLGFDHPWEPLEILAIDFTVLEPAADERENVLVMTDVFTKRSESYYNSQSPSERMVSQLWNSP